MNDREHCELCGRALAIECIATICGKCLSESMEE